MAIEVARKDNGKLAAATARGEGPTTARWHSTKTLGGGREWVLFVGTWEWRVNSIADILCGQHDPLLGDVCWRAHGPGVEGGRPTSPGSVLTRTLLQAKSRCEDAALRCVEACASDLGMKVVPL